MKNFFWLLFKIFLLVFLALVSWGLALFLNWPLWGGLAIFLSVIGLYVGVLLFRRLWIIQRSRAQLAKSNGSGASALGHRLSATHQLVVKWKQAVALLRRSSLKRFGNPLRVLPWFAVIGESKSGKTTAINRSRLSFAIKPVDADDPIIQTDNFDWWFFNKSIVIDTAGRYVSPNAGQEDEAEWNKLLDLLHQYRPKDGLDGLVIAIDADKLLQNDSNLLVARGRALRERIDQTIRLFDRRLPIYILITKCDLIYGFKQWASTLSQEHLEQAMGYLGPAIEGDQAELDFIEVAFNQIEDRLKTLRLDAAMRGLDVSPEVLLFPAEVARLRAGLQVFLSASLGNSPFLEQPLLRGIFLSSGKQSDTEIPSAFGALNSPPRTVAQEEKGFFLRDLFDQVLPADRGYFRPTVLVNRWRQVTRNLAIVCWLSFWFAAGFFVLISFQATRSVLNDIKVAYPYKLGEINSDMTSWQVLSARRQVLAIILASQQNWRTRWLAFSPEIDSLENALTAEYVKEMRNFLNETEYAGKVNEILANPDHPLYASWVLAKIRIMNRRSAGLVGVSYADLMKMPGIPTSALSALDESLPPDVLASFDAMLCAYFAWAPNGDPIITEDQVRNENLLREIFRRSTHAEWLLRWADDRRGAQEVTVNQFWTNVDASMTRAKTKVALMPSTSSEQLVGFKVRPAFTQAGDKRIKGFLDEAQKAMAYSNEFVAFRAVFDRFYRSERFNAWFSFATSFPSGEKLLVGEPMWRETLNRIYVSTGPYVSLVERLQAEFADIPKEELPTWLLFVREFGSLKHEGGGSGLIDQASKLMLTVNTIGGDSLKSSWQAGSFNVPSDVNRTIQVLDAHASYLREYQSVATQALEGEGKSFQLASDFFAAGLNPAVKASALRDLQDTLANIKKLSGFNRTDTQVVWPLIEGPLRLLIQYVLEQASCSLQSDWEKSVLWRSRSAVSVKEASDQLFGAQGSVWNFASTTASPFILQTSSSFAPAIARGYALPFSAGFMPFLNTSVDNRVSQLVKDQQAETAKGRSVKFALTARPINVNPSAKVKPFSAVLSVQCDNNEIVLNNFNIQSSDSFVWSPDLCGDTALSIKVEKLTLTRRYPGPMGFPRFVQEFQDGERIFTPEDFPGVKEELDELDVKAISVRYDFVGQEALLKLADDVTYLNEKSAASPNASANSLRQFNVPQRVGQCWREGLPSLSNTEITTAIDQRVQNLLGTGANSGATGGTFSKPVQNPTRPSGLMLPTAPSTLR